MNSKDRKEYFAAYYQENKNRIRQRNYDKKRKKKRRMTNNTNIYKSVFMGFKFMAVGDVHRIEPPEGKSLRQLQSELLGRIRHWKRVEGKEDYVFKTNRNEKEVVLTRTK